MFRRPHLMLFSFLLVLALLSLPPSRAQTPPLTFHQNPKAPGTGQLTFTQTTLPRGTGGSGSTALAQQLAAANAQIQALTAAATVASATSAAQQAAYLAQISSLQTTVQQLQQQLAAATSGQAGQATAHMVWVHDIPAAYGTTFASHHPLDFVPGGPAVTDSLTVARYTLLKSYGADGVSVDRFTDPGYFAQVLRCADAAGILVAPCVDLSLVSPNSAAAKQAAAITYIQGWITASAGHTSAAKMNGAYVVFTFAQSAMPASNWQAVRTALAPTTLYLVGDCGVGTTTSASAFASALNANIASVDMPYWFGQPFTPTDYGRMSAAFIASGKAFCLPVMPGYAREGQVQTDALGDLNYEGGWQSARAIMAAYPAQANWVHITTAGDWVEQTDILPSSTKSYAMMTMTSWYAALVKGLPPPFTTGKLVLSSPMCLYQGQSSQAVVRAYNPTAKSALLSVRIYDPYGNGLGLINTPIPPMQTVAVPVPLTLSSTDTANSYVTVSGSAKSCRLDSYGHGWLFVTATLSDDLTGTQIASLTSAPVSLYKSSYPGSLPRTLYYSVQSGYRGNDANLAATCYVHKNGSFYAIDASAPAGITAKYIEVLHDNRQVYLAYNVQQLSYVHFAGAPSNPLDAYPGDTSDHDDWKVRLIDVNDHVYYTPELHLLTP